MIQLDALCVIKYYIYIIRANIYDFRYCISFLLLSYKLQNFTAKSTGYLSSHIVCRAEV